MCTPGDRRMWTIVNWNTLRILSLFTDSTFVWKQRAWRTLQKQRSRAATEIFWPCWAAGIIAGDFYLFLNVLLKTFLLSMWVKYIYSMNITITQSCLKICWLFCCKYKYFHLFVWKIAACLIFLWINVQQIWPLSMGCFNPEHERVHDVLLIHCIKWIHERENLKRSSCDNCSYQNSSIFPIQLSLMNHFYF